MLIRDFLIENPFIQTIQTGALLDKYDKFNDMIESSSTIYTVGTLYRVTKLDLRINNDTKNWIEGRDHIEELIYNTLYDEAKDNSYNRRLVTTLTNTIVPIPYNSLGFVFLGWDDAIPDQKYTALFLTAKYDPRERGEDELPPI